VKVANPRGNLAGWSDPEEEGWQQRALDRVAERRKRSKRNTERKNGLGVYYDDPFRPMLDEACRRRGISMAGYARRAVAAFVAHDLGLPLSEVVRHMALPTTYRAEGGHGRVERTNDTGRGMGAWKIEGLREL
jgi:hypothetical protein